MKVREVMTKDVQSIPLDSSLVAAARSMKFSDFGSLPVVDGDRLVGILTDRDIVVRAIAEGRDPTATQVGDVMTPSCFTVSADASTDDCAQQMREHQVQRMIAVDSDGRLAGIVSTGDLAQSDRGATANAMEGIKAP